MIIKCDEARRWVTERIPFVSLASKHSYCLEKCPDNEGWVCCRIKGHDGSHVQHSYNPEKAKQLGLDGHKDVAVAIW